MLGEHDRNIFWMCNTCADLFSNDQFKKISLCNDRERAVVPDVIQSMKDDIQKLSNAISTLTAKVDVIPQPNQPATPPPWNKINFLLPNTPKRRRVVIGETAEPVNNRNGNHGTKVAMTIVFGFIFRRSTPVHQRTKLLVWYANA